jgi:hypothetical protein
MTLNYLARLAWLSGLFWQSAFIDITTHCVMNGFRASTLIIQDFKKVLNFLLFIYSIKTLV